MQISLGFFFYLTNKMNLLCEILSLQESLLIKINLPESSEVEPCDYFKMHFSSKVHTSLKFEKKKEMTIEHIFVLHSCFSLHITLYF